MRQLLLKVILVALLSLSLAIKVFGNTLGGDEPPAPVPDSIRQYFEQRGFTLSTRLSVDGPALVATLDQCRVEIANVSPHGWHKSVMEQEASGQRLAYLYAGSIYGEQPVALTKLGYYWHKLTHYFVASPVTSVRAAIVSPGCPDAAANLDTLAVLSR